MNRLALAVSLLSSLSAGAYELRKDSTGSTVHWKDTVTFVMDADLPGKIGEPAALDAVIAAVATVQAAVPELKLTAHAGPTGGVSYDASPGATNVNAIVALTDWPYDENAIAVTIVSVNTATHEVVDADIALNLASREFRKLPPEGDLTRTYDDLQNTLTHELGHALGLGHVPEEPAAVMYPGAIRGEVNKRVLTPDDEAGLAFLYPPSAAATTAPAAKAMGCSAGAGGTWTASVFVLLGLLLRSFRPRSLRALAPVAASALALYAPLASAAAPKRPAAKVLESAWTGSGTVQAAQVVAPTGGARVLTTELSVAVTTCHKGPCPTRVTVRVPGGKLGNLEQSVDGAAVPAVGAALGLTWSRPERLAPRALAYRLYVLERMSDFSAFAEGLALAQAAHEGSPAPLASPATRPSSL